MMLLRESFEAWGHPSIRSSHKTTLMITKERDLTYRGDCVISVRAEKGLKDLDARLKEAIRRSDARILLTIKVGDVAFNISGRGDQRLALSHPTDLVVRKSSYTCDRTLMIHADKAACDLDDALVRLLQNGRQAVHITITVEL
jgi:hypothetical protein